MTAQLQSVYSEHQYLKRSITQGNPGDVRTVLRRGPDPFVPLAQRTVSALYLPERGTCGEEKCHRHAEARDEAGKLLSSHRRLRLTADLTMWVPLVTSHTEWSMTQRDISIRHCDALMGRPTDGGWAAEESTGGPALTSIRISSPNR